MRSCHHTLFTALIALTALAAWNTPAQAQTSSFTVRVPVAAVLHAPAIVAYNFGNVLIGDTPERIFTFTNKGSTSTTLSPLSVSGSAVVASTTCTGTLAPAQSCTMKLGLAVPLSDFNSGEVRVAHTGTDTPDLFRLTATGVSADSVVRFVPVLLDFGDQPLKVASTALTADLVNQGATSVDINAVSVSEGALQYTITDSTCEGASLAPGSKCTVTVVFSPQSIGFIQGRLRIELGDGTLVNGLSLAGTAVQGIVSWTSSQLNFVNVATSQKSPSQKATVTNSGRAPFGITSLTAVGDSAFEIDSSTCGATVSPGASCDVLVAVTPPDGTIRTATLELVVTGASPGTTRIQLYAVPVSEIAILTMTPSTLSFAAVPLGQAKSLTLNLKSTGTLPVNVSGYRFQGAAGAKYTSSNAATCTGSLAPGMECNLTVTLMPTAVGPQDAQLLIDADSTTPLPAVVLSGQGTSGVLSVTPGVLDFGAVEIAKAGSLTSTLQNTGTAPLTVNSLATASASAAGYTTAGCVGQTLAPSASCTLTVTFTPTTVGQKLSTLSVAHTGLPSPSSLGLTGNAVAAPTPAANFSAFTCPSPAQAGVAFVCTAMLTNSGPIPVSVGALTASGTGFGTPTSDCPATLSLGATCNVSLPGNIATPGAYSATVSVVTGAGNKAASANVSVQSPQAALTIRTHASPQIGSSSTTTHLVSNTGAFPVTLSLPGTVGNAVFAVTGTTCPTTLAAGTSCDISTSCTPTSTVTVAANLSLNSSAGLLSQPLSCTGTLPPATGSAIVATPNPVDGGSVPVGSSVTRSFSLRNTSLSPIQITALGVAGIQPADFSFSASSCITTLAANATCSGTVTFSPKGTGARSAQISITSTASGATTPVQLKGTGTQGVLTLQPSALDFGTGTVGVASTKTISLFNTGDASLTVSAAPTLGGTNASQYTATANCYNVSIAPGGSCTMSVTFTPTGTAATTAALRMVSNATSPSIDVPLSGSATPAPAALAVLSDFACPSSAQTGTSFTCTATLSSTGNATLGVTSLTRSNTTFGTPTSNCPASMPAGTSCTITMTSTLAAAGTQTTNVTVATSVGSLTKPVSISSTAPSLSFAPLSHGNVQVGSTQDTAQTLSNLGSGPVTLNLPSASGVGFSYVAGSSTCGATLAAGASCQYTARCTPSVVGPIAGSLTENAVGASSTALLSCQGVAGSASATLSGPSSLSVGGWSRSGNWYRIANTGVGPLTIQGFYPANTNWTLYSDSTNSGHCVVNKVLQPGQDCLVMEVLITGAPGSTYSGTQRVRTSIGDLTWASSMRTYGVSVQELVPFANLQSGNFEVGQFTVTNLAPYPLSAITANVSGTGFLLESTDCTSLAATGGSGSSCVVQIRATAPTNSILTMAGSLQIVGAYPQVINGVTSAASGNGVQGSRALAVATVAPSGTLTMGAYPATDLNTSAFATHTLLNTGLGPWTVSASPTVSQGMHKITSTGCYAGLTLQAGQSCAITTQFSPVDSSSVYATLTAKVSFGSGTFTGTLSGSLRSDVEVTMTDFLTSMPTGATTPYYVIVKNGPGGPAFVTLDLASFESNGAHVTARNAASCFYSPAGTSCSATGNRVTIKLAPYTRVVVLQSLTAGTTGGIIGMNANATVTGVEEPTTANNTATGSTTVVAPKVGDPVLVLQKALPYDIGPDFSIYTVTGANYAADKKNLVEKYSPSGQLLASAVISLPGCTDGYGGGYTASSIAVDNIGKVHVGLNCQVGAALSSKLMRLSADLVQEQTMLASPDAAITNLVSQGSTVGAMMRKVAIGSSSAYYGVIQYYAYTYLGIANFPSDYSNNGKNAYLSQSTYNENGASTGSTLVLLPGGGAISYFVSGTYSNGNYPEFTEYLNLSRVSGDYLQFTGPLSLVFTLGPSAYSPSTGHVYGASAYPDYQLIRLTSPPYGKYVSLVPTLTTKWKSVHNVRIDKAGCLYAVNSSATDVQGIYKTTECGF